MRKTTLVSGIVFTSMIFLGVILKFLHLPGGSALVVLGVGLVMVMFLPMLLIYRLKNDTTAFQRTATVFGFVAGWLFIFPGLLFSIQRWPGGITLYLFGSFLALIFLVLFFLSRAKAGNPVSPREPFTIIVVLLVAILFTGRYFVRERGFERTKQNIENYYATLQERRNMEQAVFGAYSKIPFNEGDTSGIVQSAQRLHKNTTDVLQYINELRGEVVGNCVGIDPRAGDTLSARFIDHPTDYDTPTHYFIGYDPANVTGKSKDLNVVLKNYLKENYSPEKTKKVMPGDVYSEEYEKLISWEWHHFYHKTIIEVITTLAKIQTDILALEKEALEKKEFISPR